VADDLARGLSIAGLADLNLADQGLDDVSSQMRAIRRRNRGAFLALEIIVQDKIVMILGNDQVVPGPLEIAMEKKLRVRNNERVRRRMDLR
jgi:hypothetical protein